jgi:two-component system, cell cycle sensor histidine kinase and response regulator CckA
MSDDSATDPVEGESRARVVFFVDDDDEIRKVTSLMLERRGFEVVLAASAGEASQVAETFEGKIDVLLMDINLPDGFGATVAHLLRQVRTDMPVVFTTGFAESDPVLSDGLSHAEFVVTKPFTIDELVDELERAMSSGDGE